MVGRYVFTQNDTQPEPGDVRTPVRPDAIAAGDYSHNCHGTGHEGPTIGGRHTGEFYQATAPFQVPYGVLVPVEVDNLLVPVAVSASHVGFCALRLEPIWTALGQAAGVAAHLAVADDLPVADVDVGRLQSLLHEVGAITVYVPDVPPGSELFAAVQHFATRGAFHGLRSRPPGPDALRKAWKSIPGWPNKQAYPWHDADLGRPVEADLLERWIGLLPQGVRPRVSDLRADGSLTRGRALRRLFALVNTTGATTPSPSARGPG